MEEKSFSPLKSVTILRRASNIPFQISCRAESTFNRRKIVSKEEEANLDVIWGPEMVYDEKDQVSICEGSSTTLSCPFQSYPPPLFTWVLHQGDHAVEKSTDGSKYTIESASPRDTGKWTCTAKNPVTGAESSRTTNVNVELKPTFSSPDVQEVGKNKTRPIVMCTFQHTFSTENFEKIQWTLKNDTHQFILDRLNMKMPNEIGTAEPVTSGRYQAKWTDVTDKGATALLTINDATEKELQMDFICDVKNSVGMSRKFFFVIIVMA